jgi:hypothetical protein
MEVCLDTQEWLQISDYSSKHKISVSTLRRRIRSGEIEYKFEYGKYWLLEPTKVVKPKPSAEGSAPLSPDATEVAQAMIAELKSAYVQILQEKEQQILQLREELTDLQTLCRILEKENERLKAEALPASAVTDWLSDDSNQSNS